MIGKRNQGYNTKIVFSLTVILRFRQLKQKPIRKVGNNKQMADADLVNCVFKSLEKASDPMISFKIVEDSFEGAVIIVFDFALFLLHKLVFDKSNFFYFDLTVDC